MTVTKEKPEILRFIYRQEKGDPHCGSCLWAIFDIDPGRGILNIQSDCGNYAYRWPERDDDFLKLLIGLHEDYLLEKLCGRPKEFDQEATISRIKEYLEEMEITSVRKEHAIKDLEITLNGYSLEDSPSLAEFIVDEWNNDQNLEIDCAWELVRKRYGAHQKRIVRLFIAHIEPAIKQELLSRWEHRIAAHEKASKNAGRKVKVSTGSLAGNAFIIEDWWDRVYGTSWMKSNGNPAALDYAMRAGFESLPIDDECYYGKIGGFGHIIHKTQLEGLIDE